MIHRRGKCGNARARPWSRQLPTPNTEALKGWFVDQFHALMSSWDFPSFQLNRVWSKMISKVPEPVMNTPSSTDSAPSDRPNPLGITEDSKPTVPVFSCIVYVCKTADGTIRGRVANLAGDDSGEISATGNSERVVKAAPAFWSVSYCKRRIR